MMKSLTCSIGGSAMAAVTLLLAGCTTGQQEQWSTREDSRPDRVATASPASIPTTVTQQDLEALNKAAIELLLQAAESPNPLLKANAIEALHAAPEFLDPVIRDAVLDTNRGVRFAAAMTVGKLRMKRLIHLIAPLTIDESESVRAAAIYAMKQCYEPVDLDPLATFILSEDPEVRGNTAFILGELGDPSAVPLLRTAASRPIQRTAPIRARIVDLQIAEALVKLGSRREIEAIQAALFAPAEQGELVAFACQILGRLRDANSAPNLQDFATREGPRQQPPEIRIAAAYALWQIDPDRNLWEIPARFLTDNRAEVRALAAFAAGAMGARPKAAEIGALIDDPNPLVQIAAAAGILRMQADDAALASSDASQGRDFD